jgi:hypothetical protein
MNSNLDILGTIYAGNLPNVSTYNIVITQTVLINFSTYYKYDLDLRQYTSVISNVPYILHRKFTFRCCLLK